MLVSNRLPGFVPIAPRSMAIARFQPIFTPRPFMSPRMAQQTSQEPPLVQDLQAVVSIDQWAAQTWTKDGAIATYNVANLLWTIREKVAFSALAFKDLVSDPRILGTLQRTEDGRKFIEASNAVGRWSKQLSQPNLMSSVRNRLSAMEINIFPKFGVSVKGFRPLLSGNKLTSVRAETTLRPEVIDFGNLYDTPIESDVNALQAATEDAEAIAPEIKVTMGIAIPVLAVFLIKAAVVIGGALLIGHTLILPGVEKIAQAIKPTFTDPEALRQIDEIRKTDPKKATEMMDRLTKTKQFWEAATDIVKWVAIGVGTLAVAWILSSVLGLFSKAD
jgi:hypothetical protein